MVSDKQRKRLTEFLEMLGSTRSLGPIDRDYGHARTGLFILHEVNALQNIRKTCAQDVLNIVSQKNNSCCVSLLPLVEAEN